VREPEAAVSGAPGPSRTVLVSFLGAVVRRMGGWTPIAGTVDLMAQAGLDSTSVRTAVFRLKKRGWLEPETRSGRRGYALTPTALDVLAAGDEVIWHARRPAVLADGWCVVTFSLPESARTQRHRLRSHLASLGFGNAASGVWLAPARLRGAAERAISELGLTSSCAVFVGDYVAGQDLSDLLHGSWDLADIDRRYRAFIEDHQPVADRLCDKGPTDARDAFVTYLGVVDHWRKLPFRDPGLPRELLADDWAAPAATALFEQLTGALEGPALAHAASHWRQGEA
jgi:phenylacetic acid degradation operon negative regulatory protein